MNLGTWKTLGQGDNSESWVSGDECGVDVYSISSLQDKANDEAGVSGSEQVVLEVSSNESSVYKVMQGSTGEEIGM